MSETTDAMPTVTPYLLYADAGAALDWLQRAFGFEERLRYAEPDGTVTHGEAVIGTDGLVMLGHPGPGYRSPADLGARTHVVHVTVDDVDAHCAAARDAGAEILSEPEDTPYGMRRYRVADPEGHLWIFAQRVAEVAPDEWGAVTRP